MAVRSVSVVVAALAYGATVASRVGAGGQLPETFFDERSAPAIAYATQQPNDPVARLNDRLAAGSAAALSYEPGSGYLRAVLNALAIPVESQLASCANTLFGACCAVPSKVGSMVL